MAAARVVIAHVAMVKDVAKAGRALAAVFS